MKLHWKQQYFLGFSTIGKINICFNAKKLLGISDSIENFSFLAKILEGAMPPL